MGYLVDFYVNHPIWLLIVNAMGIVHFLANIAMNHLSADFIGVPAFPIEHSFDGWFSIESLVNDLIQPILEVLVIGLLSQLYWNDSLAVPMRTVGEQ